MESLSSLAGRPSLSDLRRGQLLESFILLIADRGLDSVTLDDIAAAAGLKRAAVRHYVGNRRALLAAALETLVGRFQENVYQSVGRTPSFDKLIDHLFSDQSTQQMRIEHQAFDVLAKEAKQDPAMKRMILAAYDLLISEIAEALCREHPHAARDLAYDCAYAVACIAEHHGFMAELEHERSRSGAAARATRLLAIQLGSMAPSP
jgi:AcrR family transcriptional regulator